MLQRRMTGRWRNSNYVIFTISIRKTVNGLSGLPFYCIGHGRHQSAIATADSILAHEPGNVLALELMADDALFSGNLEQGRRLE